ncbi:MAG: hypothetical protein ACHP9Z_05035 [Streptosporangiales bacterium]
MVTASYAELFAAIAASAAALTGLLFVAMSVAPRERRSGVIQQVRASAALLSFVNALAVSLFGLVPHNYLGYPALVMGIIGILFTLAGLRSIVSDPVARRRGRGQIGLIMLLLTCFGVELAAGLILLQNERSQTGVDLVGNVLVASLVIGIARSWELVGDRDTGILTSIAALAGRERLLGETIAGAGSPDPRPAASRPPEGAAAAGQQGAPPAQEDGGR